MATRQTRRQFLADLGAVSAGAAVTLALGGCTMTGRKPFDRAGSADAELILFNGSVSTLDSARPRASAFAVRDGRFIAVGDDADILRLKGPGTRSIDLGGRCVIPGLNDSHLHVIRGGLNYNLE